MSREITRGNKTYRVRQVFFGNGELTEDDVDAIEAEEAEEAEQESENLE